MPVKREKETKTKINIILFFVGCASSLSKTNSFLAFLQIYDVFINYSDYTDWFDFYSNSQNPAPR